MAGTYILLGFLGGIVFSILCIVCLFVSLANKFKGGK